MRKKRKPPVSPSSNCSRQAVLCGIIALFCLFNIRTMWFFFLFFTGLCVFNIRYYIKFSEREQEFEKKQRELEGEQADDEDCSEIKNQRKIPSFIVNHKALNQKRQERYNEFLDNLENQLGDFDIDEDDYDDYDDI